MQTITIDQLKEIKAHVTFGNSKLPKTTMIFNMGAATDCPSSALGLCQNHKICYAKKAEIQYNKTCPQYRRRQEAIWKKYSALQLAEAFKLIISKKRIKIDAFRFNESGDFWSQECIAKLEEIAGWLALDNITTYGYTHRHDLSFDKVTYLHIMGSNKPVHGEFRTVTEPSGNYPVCIGDCTKCTLCQHSRGIVEVVVH